MFYSIQPNFDMWMFVDFWFFPQIYLSWTSDVQNNFRFSSGKFGGKHRNQQTIICQVLAELNKIWSCLIFIKLYFSISLHFRIENHIFIMTINLCKSVVKVPSYLIFSIHTNFLTCNKTELNAGCSFRCILKL